jgi:hypothetical protein
VYPFHLAIPDDLETTPSSVTTLLLLGPITGWGLWLQLASMDNAPVFDISWVSTLAVITLAFGGLMAWSSKTPRMALPWIGVGITGAVLLAAGLSKDHARTIVLAGSVTWVLGTTVLSLSEGLRRDGWWWSLPPLFGALALIGAPFTLGFAVEATLMGGLTQAGQLVWSGALFIGNCFLISALVRLLLSPASPENSRWSFIGRGIGLGLPALVMIVAGFYPSLLVGGDPPLTLGTLFRTSSLPGWLVWIISLAGGGVLAWQEKNIRSRMELWLSAFHDLLHLDWLYDTLVQSLNRGLIALRVADEVISGAGALLWSWLLFLIVLLAWSGR